MRVVQTSHFLKDVLHHVVSGEITPAEFQRPYVWRKSDVLALMESILQGYPIGSFLLWSPGNTVDIKKSSRNRLGPIYAKGIGLSTSLLLDGQNRLATMAWAMRTQELPPPDDLTDVEKTTWDNAERLMLDLEKKAFVFVSEEDARTGLKLPACDVIDSKSLNRTVRKLWDSQWASFSDARKDEALKWVDTCSQAFSDAKVTVTDIQRATPEEALNAFLHICRVGVPMTEADFVAVTSQHCAVLSARPPAC